jgi:hypothetical protein
VIEMKKIFCVFLLVLLVGGLFFVTISCIGETQAQSVSKKPAVPEFTVEFIDNSYDVPPSQSVDPFTGETITKPGYHVEAGTIKFTIKNQPNYSNLMYNIRCKGYYSDTWAEAFRANDGFPLQSDSAYTEMSFSGINSASFGGPTGNIGNTCYGEIFAPFGGKVDYQVQAMDGVLKADLTPPVVVIPYYFEGETSKWSNTKTLTIGTQNNAVPSQPGSTPNPTDTSDQSPQTEITIAGLNLTEFSLVTVLCAIIVVLVVAVVYKRKSLIRKT